MGKKSENNKFKQWSIKKKMQYSFGLIVVSAIFCAAALIIGMQVTVGKLAKLYEGPIMNIIQTDGLYYPLVDTEREIFRLLAMGPDGFEEYYPEVEEKVDSNNELRRETSEYLHNHLLTQESRDLLSEIDDYAENVLAQHRAQVISLMKAGDYPAALEYSKTHYSPVVKELEEKVDRLDQSVLKVAAEFKRTSMIVAYALIAVSLIFLVDLILISIKLALKTMKAILHPVNEIVEAAKKMRVGQLSAADEITYESEDELGILAQAMRETIHTLDDYIKEIVENFEQVAQGDLTREFDDITDYLGDFKSIKTSFVRILIDYNKTLTQIQGIAAQIESGSNEVANSATDLASGTEEQASAVEELTATVNTISSVAENVAREAEEAYNGMMLQVKEAQEEKHQMAELQEEMLRIKEISGEIETIIASIEEIAAQTSLLSLNASIEAARAGEAGRGFAVVADQIGKLATDSAQAVVNTRELIGKTVEEIEKGNRITEKTAVGFEKIIKVLESSAEAMKSNSESSRDQLDALIQVESGIEQISLVTQQNAAASQESSAISEELAARSIELDNMVRQFKLYENK